MLDHLGNETTAADNRILAGIDDFIGGFLSYERRAVNVLEAADNNPENMLASTYAGMIFMFLESPGAQSAAKKYLDRINQNQTSANEREQMNAAVLRAWHANGIGAAISVCETIVDRYPTDLVAVKLGQYFHFNRGNAPGMLRLPGPPKPPTKTIPISTAWQHLPLSNATCWKRLKRLTIVLWN